MTKTNYVEELGYNYIYHYNEFREQWYCIPRDNYLAYWSDLTHANTTSGNSPEEAAQKMLKKI